MVLTSEINTIATSSAELCSAVFWRALACSGVLWRALACSGVLWRSLACSGVLWRVLACYGVLWRSLACSGVLWHALACSGVLWRALLCRTQLPDNRTQITWIIFKNLSALMCIFLKLFVHELLYKFIDSIDLKWCIGHWFTHPEIKKMVLTSEINIIATSSAKLCSAVFWRALACSGVLLRALACSGVLWRALACSGVLWCALACSGVLCCALLCRTKKPDNRNPLHDNRTQITWIIFKNSSALMCIFLKLFVHELLYKFIDSIDLKWCIGHWLDIL